MIEGKGMEKVNTVDYMFLLKDAKKALENKAFFSALSLTFDILESCAKYDKKIQGNPDSGCGERFISFYDKYCYVDDEDGFPEIDGAFAWQIRNCLVHDQTIKESGFKKENKKIKLRFSLEEKDDFSNSKFLVKSLPKYVRFLLNVIENYFKKHPKSKKGSHPLIFENEYEIVFDIFQENIKELL